MSETKKTTRTKKTATTAKKPVVKASKAVVKPEVKVEAKPVRSSYLDVPVYDMAGQETKVVTLPKEIFGVEASPRLLAQYVRVYRVNARQGNASTKTRSEVVGTTKKIFRQKGTGRARHGSKKAPIFVGGGVTFGPQPRDFSLKISKKQRRRAFLGALTLKAKDHSVAVMSSKVLDIEPKTRLMAGFFKGAGYGHDRVLLVLPKMEKSNLILAARNLPAVEVTSLESLNAYDVLKHKKLLFTEDAVSKLGDMFKKN